MLVRKTFCEKNYASSEIVPKQGVFAYDSGRDAPRLKINPLINFFHSQHA